MAVTGNQPRRIPKISWAKLPITKIGIEIKQQRAHRHQVVDELAPPNAGQHAGADADHGLDEHRHQAELERGGPAGGQLVDDPVAEEVHAEVALHQVAHVEQVLDDQRLVEVVVGPELGDVALRARALAAATDRRITRGRRPRRR